MIISAIAAMSSNRVIGRNNDLPWSLPADMKFFMRTTKGHHVIMGRKTFESMGVPLKNRTNIVITRDMFYAASGIIVAHSLHEALAIAKKAGEAEVFIIGGAEIYTLALPILDRIYLTEIDLTVQDGDAFFPEFDPNNWMLTSQQVNEPDQKNPHPFVFNIYERRKM
ncbi:MAG: dihydrofolate reductase [Saprospiraceae bacterium]|nr:dihydrofolate reductase [Saprospiraceae bacterium]